MSVRTVQLEEVATVFNGKTPSKAEQRSSGHPVLKIKDVDESGRFIGRFDSFVDFNLAESLTGKKVRDGDTLILNAAHNAKYVASKSFFARGSAVGALATGEWLILRPVAAHADARFIYYWSQHLQTRKKLGELVKGIHLYPKDVEKLSILLPNLSEQKRIAGLLERTDRLRRTRSYAHELSDNFLPAVFVELFGDLVHNERHWGVRVLDEIADIASGIAKGQKYGIRETREVPYLRVANVQDGYLNLSEIKMIEALPGDVEHLRLQKGDIVMTEGGDFDKLGRGAIWPGGIKDCIHQNHIFRVRVNKSELLPEFFAAFLRSPAAKNYFLRCSKQTTNLASINMTQLRATPVALPPLSLQHKFAMLVECHERLRATQREELRQAEHLFQTQLHNAFTADQ